MPKMGDVRTEELRLLGCYPRGWLTSSRVASPLQLITAPQRMLWSSHRGEGTTNIRVIRLLSCLIGAIGGNTDMRGIFPFRLAMIGVIESETNLVGSCLHQETEIR